MKFSPLAIVLLLAANGCQRYERVIEYNPPLANLPGAVTQTAPVRPKSEAQKNAGDGKIVIEHEDGRIELISRNGLQMLTHIRRLVAARGEDAKEAEELFTEQILSNITRQEFLERGYDPAEAFKELQRRETDLMAMLARMPMGEFTPGLFLKPLGRNTFRLEVPARMADGLKWKFVDIVVERGVWKLRWFGP